MATNQIKRRVRPRNISWANYGDNKPFPIRGDSNEVSDWYFFECQHATQRCVEREEECQYEEDDLKAVLALDFDSVFSSFLPKKDEFKVAMRIYRDAIGTHLPRIQIRDMNNKSISCICEIDPFTKEVFVVTVMTPTDGFSVKRKNHWIVEVASTSSLPDGYSQLMLLDNRYEMGVLCAKTFCMDTTWWIE